MTPLMAKIIAGLADTELERIINDLEAMKKNGGISVNEQLTLNLAYSRLEELTRPSK